MNAGNVEAQVQRLDSFDAVERREALEHLAEAMPEKPPRKPEVNVHCHTFFSYNAYGYSPSRFAWEAHRYGLEVAGIVDFDVLDGVEEFLAAGRLLRLKTVAGFESRVYVPEYSDTVLNSPKEPGVMYLITSGFTELPPPGSAAAETLRSMSECAQQRNRRMMKRVNEHLDPVTIDYGADVLPLTPAGNATERHMLVAYEERARELFQDPDERARFWSEKLDEPEQKVQQLLHDVVALKRLMRRKLMKHGGVGYSPPDEGSFPALDEVLEMTHACGALPSGGWVDGTSEGESDPMELFSFFREKGMPLMTIVPDRNWNIDDSEEKALKVSNLHEAVAAAEELEMPILVGTEMNKYGQKFVDTFSAPPLEPHRDSFLDGARTAWGHTLLKMTTGLGLESGWSKRHFDERAARNRFFRRVGRPPYPEPDVMARLARAAEGLTPEAVLDVLNA